MNFGHVILAEIATDVKVTLSYNLPIVKVLSELSQSY